MEAAAAASIKQEGIVTIFIAKAPFWINQEGKIESHNAVKVPHYNIASLGLLALLSKEI